MYQKPSVIPGVEEQMMVLVEIAKADVKRTRLLQRLAWPLSIVVMTIMPITVTLLRKIYSSDEVWGGWTALIFMPMLYFVLKWVWWNHVVVPRRVYYWMRPEVWEKVKIYTTDRGLNVNQGGPVWNEYFHEVRSPEETTGT